MLNKKQQKTLDKLKEYLRYSLRIADAREFLDLLHHLSEHQNETHPASCCDELDPARPTVKLELSGINGMFPVCNDDECRWHRECAQHASAGDFRSEDGDTPKLFLLGNKKSLKNIQVICQRRFVGNAGTGEHSCSRGALVLNFGREHELELIFGSEP